MLQSLNIINEYNAGDIAAFNKVFTIFFGILHYISFKITNSHEIADEVISDVFLKSWHKRGSYKSIHHLKNYLIQATRNRSIDYLRSEKSYRMRLSNIEVREFDIDDCHESILKLASSLLFGGQKEVFDLLFLKDLDYQEAAIQLGIKERTVRNQKARAIDTLKKLLCLNKLKNI